jgi:hypothetical protein
MPMPALNFRIAPAFLLLFILLLASCTTTPPHGRGEIQHIVLCWLKEPGNPEHRRRIIERSKLFARIPGVREVRVGEVIPSERKIVDDSFDVGIVMTFDSVEQMDRYIGHPEHRWAVKEVILPLTRRILVYDFRQR